MENYLKNSLKMGVLQQLLQKGLAELGEDHDALGVCVSFFEVFGDLREEGSTREEVLNSYLR